MIRKTGFKLPYVLGFVLLAVIVASCGTSKKEAIKIEQEVYAKALAANDAGTAIGAAYRILMLDPTQKNYYDTIASIYFTTGNYLGALEVARGITTDHTNKELFEILAYSTYNLGKFEDASLYLQDLIELDPDKKHVYLYDIAVCYFNIKNFETSFSYMKKVMDVDASRMQKKTFNVDGKAYETFYYVAALNTMGYIYIMDARYDEAEQLYAELFKIDDQFPLARNNYAMLQQLKKQAK